MASLVPPLVATGQKLGRRGRESRKNQESEVKRTLLPSCPCHGPAVRFCMSPGNSPFLSFLICKAGTVVLALSSSWICCQHQRRWDVLHCHYWMLFKNQCINLQVFIKFLIVCWVMCGKQKRGIGNRWEDKEQVSETIPGLHIGRQNQHKWNHCKVKGLADGQHWGAPGWLEPRGLRTPRPRVRGSGLALRPVLSHLGVT